VRGRYCWDTGHKEWTVSYKPFRNYWILLLLTVNERLFALQIPKVIPGKIVAQYEEQEHFKAMTESLMRGEETFKPSEGIDKSYLSINHIKSKRFERNPNKTEANV